MDSSSFAPPILMACRRRRSLDCPREGLLRRALRWKTKDIPAPNIGVYTEDAAPSNAASSVRELDARTPMSDHGRGFPLLRREIDTLLRTGFGIVEASRRANEANGVRDSARDRAHRTVPRGDPLPQRRVGGERRSRPGLEDGGRAAKEVRERRAQGERQVKRYGPSGPSGNVSR